tara:strand:- start:799 stop:1539 length:741 start_codon:yes stop_codon:yes gene_type:complete
MKFLKIIFLIFILISSANANTIFYLIKIPNLEIHSSKSINGLKYLKAIKPFDVGIKDNNVSCFNSSEKNIEKKLPIIKKNLNKYSSIFLNKINLKYIVMCENLSVSQIRAAGVPNITTRTLVVDIKFNEEHFERVLHHEIFHMINDSHKKKFLFEEWKNFNNSEFKYAKCSTCSDRLGLSLLKENKGFVTEYSMSTASEDMAEVFSFLITDKKKIENKALKDPILNKKILFLKKNILKVDENFNFN